MSESASKRFLLYQPNHGFGIELFLLESAFEIARALDRTLVLPPMPDLETTSYRRGLDEYFGLDADWPWVSAEQYRATYGDHIDLVFHIMPLHRVEYASPVIRDLHPVWLDNIERLTSFVKMGFRFGDVRRVQVDRPLRPDEISRTFEDGRPAVGISYINGMVEIANTRYEATAHRPTNSDEFTLRHVPTAVRDKYLRLAHSFAGPERYAAIHWRRGQNIQQVAKILENVELPTVETMIRAVPADVDQIIVATDVGLEAFKDLSDGYRIRSFRHEDPQINAVVDMALCIDADLFVGVDTSTFSTYIAYVRRTRGLHASTLLF
jgi:hypothetical protein